MKELSTLGNKVNPNNDLKEMIVEYTGNKINPENEEVTLEMVIDILSDEFPELLLCVSEENWVRGYHQALTDVEDGEKFLREENEKLHSKQE
tara:strand:+ start:23045 stop:23320 length:276 start_codon:yes stop_codon:yes gene_type:complete